MRSSPHETSPQDSVDRLLTSWARTGVDLDLSPVAVIARLDRLRAIIDSELAATFAEFGLSGSDFAALATLRRLGDEGAVSQRRLMRELHLTSGTVSLRVDRLNERGLVARLSNPEDRRNSLVSLTDAGRELFDQAAPHHLATENRLLAALGPEQRDQLADLLRQLLISFEGWTVEEGFPELGLGLAPAHETLRIRRSVGLPDATGLLVRSVEPNSRADRASIQIGDVLTKAAGHQLRSATTLYAAIREHKRESELTVELVRGADTTRKAKIDLRPQASDGPPPGRTVADRQTTQTI